jgi:hypothetical protein
MGEKELMEDACCSLICDDKHYHPSKPKYLAVWKYKETKLDQYYEIKSFKRMALL